MLFRSAYVGLADAYNLMPTNSALSPKEAFPQAKAAATRALAIDPSLAEAHAALATTLVLYEWNWTESEREYKKAIELNPNVADIHYYYGLSHLYATGRLDEGIREIKRGLELEPLSIPMGANIVQLYLAAGQKKQALEQAQKTYNLDPNHGGAISMLGFAYLENEMYAEAIALCEKTFQADPSRQNLINVAGVAYAGTGQRQKAEEMVARYRELAKTQYVQHTRIATIYIAFADRDKAFAELEQAFQEHESQLWSLKVDPLFAPIRDDSRYKDLLKRMNLPE